VADRDKEGASVPFWVHQAIEYLLGAFAFTSLARVEPRSAALCAGAGAALLVLPAVSGGRLGVTQLVGPRLHRVLDHLAVPVLATSPWWSGVGWGAGGVWVVEALAIAVLWLARSTAYRRVPEPPADAPSPSSTTPTASDALAGTARAAGKLAGTVGRKGPRAAGQAVGRIKRRRSGR
jgi:hypothetical protein